MKDKEKEIIGKEIAELFLLKTKGDKYLTCWGDKTPIGIYEMVKIIYLKKIEGD